MSLNTNALVTTSDVKKYIKSFDDSDAEQLAGVEFLINWASTWFENYAGVSIVAKSHTLKYKAGVNDKLIFPVYPVNSISSLKVDGVTIASTDYVLDSQAGIAEFLFEFKPGRYVVEATVTAGYTTIPDDIKAAVLEMIVWNNQRIFTSGFGVKQVTSGESVTSYELNIPFSAKAVADRYRRKAF